MKAKSKALKNKMTSHEAVREWKRTGKKPRGLHKVEIDSVMHKREE